MNRLLRQGPKLLHQLLRIMLDVTEHVGHRIALDLARQADGSIANFDTDRMSVPEEVVQVAERLLVSTDEENAEVVTLVGTQLVDRQGLEDLRVRRIMLDHPIAVAGDVVDDALASGPLR